MNQYPSTKSVHTQFTIPFELLIISALSCSNSVAK
jgi:hypothetical protein